MIFQKFFAFGINRLRRLGCNKLAFYMSKRLYESIDIDKLYGEVYRDCHDMMKSSMPDIDKNWNWMQKEHIEFLFGSKTRSEMRPESSELANIFEVLLPKKHPVAMATMEAFKADYRDEQIKTLQKEIMRWLQLPTVDATVLFSNDKLQMTVTRYDSFSPISFGVWNYGDTSIENCTVIITFPDFVMLKRNNVEKNMLPDIQNPNSSTWVYEDEHKVLFDVGNIILGLGRKSENVFVRIPHDVKEIEVTWFLSCKTANKYGKLTIKNEPEYVPDYRDK